MEPIRKFIKFTLAGALLVVIPVYLCVLLFLKAMQTIANLLSPLFALFPDQLPATNILSALLLLLLCFFIGVALRTGPGLVFWKRIEESFFNRIPGYTVIRSLSQRMAGQGQESEWKPALVEMEDGLVPAFIIEELEDGRLTVFVPSIPTPLAGAVYILKPEQVHPLEVSFTQAVTVISHWGSGSKNLVAAMNKDQR
jgi:uncharacterized membrane protein